MNRDLAATLVLIANLVKAEYALYTARARLEDHGERSKHPLITELCRVVAASE